MRATGPLLMLAALLLLLTALPDLLVQLVPKPQPLREPTASQPTDTAPPPESRPEPAFLPQMLLDDGLLARLSEADRAWIPRAEPLPDGGVRYLYKRRPNDPELSIAQIQSLIANPQSHAAEQQQIVELLRILQTIGAAVALEEPIKAGAAAEWDPQARTLRIRPDVVDQGSLEFARVLNHEAVHVAQSCAGGAVEARPRPLGLLSPSQAAAAESAPARSAAEGLAAEGPASIAPLNEPLYADLSPAERRMEAEAYSLQDRLGVGRSLISIHCSHGRSGQNGTNLGR